MPILIPIVLCLLLCGCGGPYTEVPETTVPAVTTPAIWEYGGQRMAGNVLTAETVTAFLPVEGGYLLLTETGELSLWEEDLSLAAVAQLDGEILGLWDTAAGIACYDGTRQQILFLDWDLTEIRRVTLPQNIPTPPVVSSDGASIYYTIPGTLYRWDLSTGIRQRLKELETDDLTLVALYQEDTLLQCRQAGEDLFFQTEDGRLVASHSGNVTLMTRGEEYYAVYPSGLWNAMVYGNVSGESWGLYPEELSADGYFLPDSGVAITQSGQQLTAYDLESGRMRDSLTLEEGHTLHSLHSAADGRVLLLVEGEGETLCLYWQPKAAGGGDCCREAYFPDEEADPSALELCRAYAEEMQMRYGISVCIDREAAACAPWDYRFEAERQTPVILRMLTSLNACLSQFPETVIRETAEQFDSLTICLVRSIAGTAEGGGLNQATGVQYLQGKNAYLAIAAGDYAARSLCHELFHGMETRILSTSNALDDWDKHNPAGFSYALRYDSTADRGVYLSGVHRAFIDQYSMSYPKEDRARIFEYAMLPDQAETFRSETMQEKLQAICTGIREAYDLKEYEGDLPWEQYLEN